MGGAAVGARHAPAGGGDPPPPSSSAPIPPSQPVEQANFGLSGALARDAATGNTVNGVVLKFVKPPEARLPLHRWRLYVFKGEAPDPIEVLHLHRSPCFLFGKDPAVADIKLDHPSISKQHAVLMHRAVEQPREPGDMRAPEAAVKPYLMDLESSNGTFLNDARLESARYYGLRVGDKVRFGGSTREYVVVCEPAEGQ